MRFLFCCSIICGATALAQDADPTAEAETSRLSWQFVDGSSATADAVIRGGFVMLRSKPPRRLPLSHVIMARCDHGRRTAQPDVELARVILANGDQLAGTVLGIADDRVLLRLPKIAGREAPPIEIPLETVAAVVLQMPLAPRPADRLIAGLIQRREDADALFLQNGDVVSGEFIEYRPQRIEFERRGQALQPDPSGVVAIRFNPELISLPSVPPSRVMVSLSDGCFVTATNVELVDRDLICEATYGEKVLIPMQSVTALRFFSDNVVSLSALEPESVDSRSFFNQPQSIAFNQSAEGAPLRLRGEHFPLGLGMRSRSRIEWKLDGRYSAFNVSAGIDDASGGRGDVACRVLVDGKVVWREAGVTGADTVIALPWIDLQSAKTLALEIDFGERADMFDLADWVDPVLVVDSSLPEVVQ